MIPTTIKDANRTYVRPSDWDASLQGECVDLPVRVQDDLHQSAWRPTPDELAILNAGGVAVLTVWGHQPVVALGVEPAMEAIGKREQADLRAESEALAVLRSGGSYGDAMELSGLSFDRVLAVWEAAKGNGR